MKVRLRELVNVCKEVLIEGIDTIGRTLSAVGQKEVFIGNDESQCDHQSNCCNCSVVRHDAKTKKRRWPLSWVPPIHLRHPDWDYGTAL